MSEPGRKQVNLLLSKIFLSSLAIGCVTYLQPAADEYFNTGKFTRDTAKNITYFTAFVLFNAVVRYADDDETFTPHGLPGRDKTEDLIKEAYLNLPKVKQELNRIKSGEADKVKDSVEEYLNYLPRPDDPDNT